MSLIKLRLLSGDVRNGLTFRFDSPIWRDNSLGGLIRSMEGMNDAMQIGMDNFHWGMTVDEQEDSV